MHVDSSEIVSDPETESDFVPPSPLSPLLLTVSEEKRVEQCTRIGLVATHKCSSDILTEDDRREMAAIRASLGMLPRPSEVAARNGGHLDEQEVRECADTYQDSTKHQKEVSEDEDSTWHQDTSQDSTRQFNDQKLTQTSYNKRDCENDVVRISAQQCDLLLETEDKCNGPITARQSPPSQVESASVGEEWSDSASDVLTLHKSKTRNKTTCEDGRGSNFKRQQDRGPRGRHKVTTNNEWRKQTNKYGIGGKPLDYCGCEVQRKVCRGAGTTRIPQRNLRTCAYLKLTNKLRPIGPSIHPASERRRYVGDSGWLVCHFCRQQFHIGQRQEEMFDNSSLFRARGSQLLTQHQASLMVSIYTT